jgi:DNA replication regulator SLD3
LVQQKSNTNSRPIVGGMIMEDVQVESSLPSHDSEFSADSGYLSSQPGSSQAINTLISQYLDALYSAKTSLAYFAKSALGRARSEFQRVEPLQEESLNSLLETMVLKMDEFSSKYEEALPSLFRGGSNESVLKISATEHTHIMQKFQSNGVSKKEINQAALQREINELKDREYVPDTYH